MANKKDLQAEVNRLNEKYCKNTKNHLVIHEANGRYTVELTGKEYKRGNKFYRRKGSISGTASIGQDWHDTATNTLKNIHQAESRGWVRSTIKQHEPKKKKTKKL